MYLIDRFFRASNLSTGSKKHSLINFFGKSKFDFVMIKNCNKPLTLPCLRRWESEPCSRKWWAARRSLTVWEPDRTAGGTSRTSSGAATSPRARSTTSTCISPTAPTPGLSDRRPATDLKTHVSLIGSGIFYLDGGMFFLKFLIVIKAEILFEECFWGALFWSSLIKV